MQVQPYLFFDGRCEEAIEFYRKTLGAEVVMMMRFKENPESQRNAPGVGEKIMHATMRIGQSEVMASDGNCQNLGKMEGFALSLNPATAAEAQRLFTALSDGGKVQMPLGKTFWSPAFGMLADRFGVSWMVNVQS